MQRFKEHLKQGWKCTSIMMTREVGFYGVIKKEAPMPNMGENILGVDINSSRIAVSVVSKDKVLKQTYYGMDLATRQYRFELRRAVLQHHRDTATPSKAGLKLKDISRRQRNYVSTNTWMLAHKLIDLAEQHHTAIALERLRHLRRRKGNMTSKSRRKINRIPYAILRDRIISVATAQAINVIEVDAKYTSQTCPRCNHIGRENWRGYKLFKCKKCGYEANRDRVASLNIALLGQNVLGAADQPMASQISKGDAPFNGRVLCGEEV